MQKQDILIVSACLVLLFLWFVNQPAPPPRITPPETTQAPAEGQPAQHDSETDNVATIATTPNTPVADAPTLAVATVLEEFQDLPVADPVVLSADAGSEITIDPNVGGIVNITLKEFKEKDALSVMTVGHVAHPITELNNAYRSWRFSGPKIESSGEDHLRISRALLGTSLVLTQSWTVRPDRHYEIDYAVTISNRGSTTEVLTDLRINSGVMKPLETAKGFMKAGGIDQRIDLLPSGKTSPKTVNIEKIAEYDDDDIDDAAAWRHDWLAVQNKYFVSFISGEKPFVGCDLRVHDVQLNEADQHKKSLLVGYSLLPKTIVNPGQDRNWQYHCFIGPKKYGLLKELDQDKESVLQFDLFLFFHFGWMKAISLGILWMLNELEAIFHNYGVAIIITTLIIRTVFWPITHQSTLWSKKMQKIQPKLQELREKYSNDPQKMQQKTMEFYRENKINPFAGCLPMFLQVPVFFALFNVLRSAIELRQASFLWAVDLSRQDTIFLIPGLDLPLNPLAILMGVTMFLQQKVVPTSADPMQQKVMMFMTIFFVFILYTMPAGLTLYWTINQTISIFQYKVTRQLDTK